MPLNTTSFAATIAVNVLSTSLIVFKILKVFLEVKASNTSFDRITLGSSGDTNTPTSKYRHIIFVIIESGMMLLVIQLVRTVLFTLPIEPVLHQSLTPVFFALNCFVGICEMCNVIIRSVHFYFFCFTEIFLPG